MKITCNHPSSSHGIPVILDDAGEVMDYGPGLTAILQRIGWKRADLARETGYSVRTVEGWWQGKIPAAKVFNRLQLALEEHEVMSPDRRCFEDWFLTEFPDGSLLRSTFDRTRYLDECTRRAWQSWQQGAQLRNS